MQIPRIIHQLWKDEHVPARWREAVASLTRYHKGWEYRLWTDALIDDYVRTKHPRFYPAVRANGIATSCASTSSATCLMHDIGGLSAISTTSSSGHTTTATQASSSRSNTTSRSAIRSRPGRELSVRVRARPSVLARRARQPPAAPAARGRVQTDVCFGDRTVVFAGVCWRNGAVQRSSDGQARVQSAPHPRPARAQVLREQRHHARVPLRLGLVARPAELRLSKGEGREAVWPQACAADSADRRVVSACERARRAWTLEPGRVRALEPDFYAEPQRARLLGTAESAVHRARVAVDVIGGLAGRVDAGDVSRIPIDDVFAVLVERVQELAIDLRLADRVRAAEVEVGLRARAVRVARGERIFAEIAQPRARFSSYESSRCRLVPSARRPAR